MNLHIIQHNYNSLASVFAYEQFLNQENFNQIKKDLVQSLEEDSSLSYQTNVQGKMTSYQKILQDKRFEFFFHLVGEVITNTLRLRLPNSIANKPMQLEFIDSWGMKHDFGDYTKTHIHGFSRFSGSYNCIVPDQNTHMYFPDFERSLTFRENQLIFFPGIIKHYVTEHLDNQNSRYSLAFNLKIKHE